MQAFGQARCLHSSSNAVRAFERVQKCGAWVQCIFSASIQYKTFSPMRCMGLVQQCSACICTSPGMWCMRSVHAFNTRHSVQQCSACIQSSNAVHAFSSEMWCMRSMHAFSPAMQSACVQSSNTVHAFTPAMQCMHLIQRCSACTFSQTSEACIQSSSMYCIIPVCFLYCIIPVCFLSCARTRPCLSLTYLRLCKHYPRCAAGHT